MKRRDLLLVSSAVWYTSHAGPSSSPCPPARRPMLGGAGQVHSKRAQVRAR